MSKARFGRSAKQVFDHLETDPLQTPDLKLNSMALSNRLQLTTVEDILIKKKAKYHSITEYAVEQIEKSIFSSNLLPGDKLPSLGELQELLGASQGAIREAMRILKEKGLIDVKRGRSGGIYVRAVPSSRISDSLALMIRQKQILPRHLLIFRFTLEVSAAALAVIESNKENVKQLETLMTRAKNHLGKGVIGWDDFYRVEDLLHQTLIKITKNPLFESVLLTIFSYRQGYNKELVPKELKNMKDSYQDWCEILEAMKKGQSHSAGRIMARHIRRFLPIDADGNQIEQLKELFL
ncbi:FCD domain-containing protein [bacterium]|nr:FCD domain-containing protein [bacterium]